MSSYANSFHISSSSSSSSSTSSKSSKHHRRSISHTTNTKMHSLNSASAASRLFSIPNSKTETDLNNNEIIQAINNKNNTINKEESLSSSCISLSTSEMVINQSAIQNLTNPSSFSRPSSSSYFQQRASVKSNDRFHQLFPSVPIEEYVIDSNNLF